MFNVANTFKRWRFVYYIPCTRLQNFVNVSLLLTADNIIMNIYLFQCGNHSGLHIIIFDEIDAICKSRGSVVSIIILCIRY